MPEPAACRAAIDRYVDAWNAEDRASWLACFAEDATAEDPVGSEPITGHGAIGAFWDGIHSMFDGSKLSPVLGPIVCGSEVVLAMQATGSAGGNEVVIDIVDHFRLNDDAKVSSLRAFWTM
jgi:steroid delta-isomerase